MIFQSSSGGIFKETLKIWVESLAGEWMNVLWLSTRFSVGYSQPIHHPVSSQSFILYRIFGSRERQADFLRNMICDYHSLPNIYRLVLESYCNIMLTFKLCYILFDKRISPFLLPNIIKLRSDSPKHWKCKDNSLKGYTTRMGTSLQRKLHWACSRKPWQEDKEGNGLGH